MGSLKEVTGTSFNQLLRVIKGISGRNSSTPRGQQNLRILTKIGELTSSICHSMREHPQHIPVLLYHLSSATSGAQNPLPRECADGIPAKFGKIPLNSCKTCNGLCDEVYGRFLEPIRERLVYLGPKGLSQILGVYSLCRNEDAQGLFRETQLRMCYFIYSGCKILRNSRGQEDLDYILDRHSGLLETFKISHLSEKDYLVSFAKFRSSPPDSRHSLADHANYYLPVNLMDVCTTLDSLKSVSVNQKNHPNQSSEHLEDGLNSLTLELSLKFLLYNSFTRVGSDSEPSMRFSNREELDTVCRLLGIFKKLKHRNELLSEISVEVLRRNLEYLDFRNLVTLLDSLTFYPAKVDSVDFPHVISRINTLASKDDPDCLRALSTVIQLFTKLNHRIGVKEYQQFRQIARSALCRYLSKWRDSLKSSESLSAVTIALKSLQDSELVSLVCDCLLEGRFSFGRSSLYDYNVVLEILLKSHSQINSDDYGTNSSTVAFSNRESYADTVHNSNFSCSSHPFKLAKTCCLIISKFSDHYCTILSEITNKWSGDLLPGSSRKDLRELCYFTRNLGLFLKKDLTRNEFTEDSTRALSTFTLTLDSFFRRHHSSLPDLDHRHISAFLSQSHILNKSHIFNNF